MKKNRSVVLLLLIFLSFNFAFTQARPDLVVTTASLGSSSVQVGGTQTVTFTVKNQGTANAGATTTQVRINTSSGSSSPSDATKQDVSTSSIAVGSQVTLSATLTIPSNFTGGTYYAHIIVDNYSAIQQSNTSNDFYHTGGFTVTVPVQLPDLVIQSASLSSSSVQAGNTQTVTFTVKNQGTGNAGATTTQVRINTSSSSSSPSDAIKQDVSTSSIATGGQVTLSATLTIPSNSVAGTYYAHIVLDNYSAIQQNNTSNDFYHTGSFSVTTVTQLPDLVVITASLGSSSVQAGNSQTVTFTVKNQGTASAGATTTQVRINTSSSSSSPSDAIKQDVSTSSIAAGGQVTLSATLTIPSNSTAGAYYTHIILDNYSAIQQSNTANDFYHTGNFSVTTVTQLPDLVVTTASLGSSSVQAGNTQTVTFTVKNQGTGNAGATTTQVRINTSSGSSSPSDAIKQDVSTSSIAVGGQVTLSATLTIPSSSTAGTYYAHIIVDNYSAIQQSDVNNDFYHTGGFSVVPVVVELPDLVVTTASLTYSSSQAGSSQTVTFTVKNQGIGNAGATTTQVRINTSSSSSSPSDAIKQDVSTPSIAAGGQVTLSATLTIPSSSTAGTYYAHLIVDNYSAIQQSNTSNDFYHTGGFTVTPSSSSAPTINSPGDLGSPGPVLTTLTPQFTWNAATGATGYGLYIRDLTTNTLVYPNSSGTTTTPLQGTSFNLPSGYLVSGHAYRWAMTSFTNSFESAQSSYRYFQTAVVDPLLPDLTISSIVQSSYASGQSNVQIPVTVARTGGQLTQGAFIDAHLFWSTNSTWDASDIRLWRSNNSTPDFPNSYLNTNGSKMVTATTNVPTVSSGTYYIIAVVDSANFHAESNENNNVTPYAVTIGSPPAFSLSFPLQGQTPWTAVINSVFDHSMISPYAKNDVVIAFTQEEGRKEYGVAPDLSSGFKNRDSTKFRINGNYSGGSADNSLAIYLYYDGHPGYDYRASFGTPVYASADGVVRYASSFPGISNAVYYKTLSIDHENGYVSYYLHLSSHPSSGNAVIPEGQRVRKGELVGYSGNAGNVAAHLHYEIQYRGVPVDPYGWQASEPDPYATFRGVINIYLWLDKPLQNNPPNTPTTVNQYKSDGTTVVLEGGTTNESTAIFKGTVSDPDGDQVKFQIELRQTAESFTGTSTLESSLVNSGTQAIITRGGLVNANYKWQYRAIDPKGAASAWREFGTAGNADFIVNVSPLLPPPTLLSPGTISAPGPDVSTTTPTFQWNSVSGVAKYGLYVSQYPYGQSNQVYQNENLSSSSTSFTLPSDYLQTGLQYRWKVASFNSTGQYSLSDPLYFVVNTGPPQVPTLVSPGTINAPGSDVSTTTPTFQWNSVSGAAKYGLYVSQYPYGQSNQVYQNENLSSSSTSFTLPSDYLQTGLQYRWKVASFSSAGQSSLSNPLYFVVKTGSLPAPTLISPGTNAESGQQLTTLTPTFQWQTVSGADQYGLYISKKNSGGTYDIIFDSQLRGIIITGATYILPSGIFVNGSQYRWSMKSHSSSGWGMSYSNVLYVNLGSVPQPPSNLQATSITSTSIVLSWAAPSDPVSGFKIYEGSSYSNLSLIAEVPTTSYTRSSLQANTKYYYAVKAYNNAGTSNFSPGLQVTSLTETVPTPTNVTATVQGPYTILVSWNPVQSADGYNFEWRQGTTAGWNPLQTTATTYSLTNLSPNTLCQARVTAVKGASQSNPSTIAQATTLSATVTLSWIDCNPLWTNGRILPLQSNLSLAELQTLQNTLIANSETRVGACADGVTRLVLRIQLNGPANNITITLQDESYPPLNTGLGVLSKFVQSSGAITLITQDLYQVGPSTYYGFVVYTAPLDFARQTLEETLSERQIRAAVSVDGQIVAPTVLKIRRPPLVLVHGLWSSPSTWPTPQELILLPSYKLYGYTWDWIKRIDYSETNSSRFNINWLIMVRQVDELRREIQGKEFACTQIDIVAHSMGGIISRLFDERSKGDKNAFQKGLVHKLITVGTPHFGTQLATVLHTATPPPTKCSEIINEFQRNISNVMGWLLLKNGDHALDGGAIEDLQYNNINTIRHLRETDPIGHAIIGTTTKESINFNGALDAFIWGYLKPNVSEWTIYRTSRYYFYHDENDRVISKFSQSGGINGLAQTAFTDILHTEETKNSKVWNTIEVVLNAPLTSPKFGKFPSVSSILPSVDSPPIRDCNENPPSAISLAYKEASDSLWVQITNLPDTVVVAPGTDLQVNLRASDISQLKLVGLVTKFLQQADTLKSLTQKLLIPYDFIGESPLLAFIADTTGKIASAHVVLRANLQALLMSVDIEGDSLAISPAETGTQLTVKGMFTDNVIRTVATYSLSFISRDTLVATISSAGLILPKRAGRTFVVTQSGSLRDSILVIVQNIPLISAAKVFGVAGGLLPGISNKPLISFTLRTDGDIALMNRMKVQRTINSTATDLDVPSVSVYYDRDTNNVISSVDSLLGAGTFSGGLASVPMQDFALSATPKRILLTINVAGSATVSKTFALEIASAFDIWTSGFVQSTNFPLTSGSENVITGVQSDATIPYRFELFQNYPNPFNPSATIKYALPQREKVVLKIYNVLGQEIMTLVNEQKDAGNYSVEWNGRNQTGQSVASGLYFYRLVAGSFVETKKMLLLR